jgi:Domain of unknown function DUF11
MKRRSESQASRWSLAVCTGALVSIAFLALGLVRANAGVSATSRADLSVAASEGADPVLVGRQVSYRVTIANRGPQSAKRARLRITIVGPARLIGRPRSSAGSCSSQGGTQVNCALGALPIRSRSTVTVRLDPGETGMISIVAIGSSTTADPRKGNNRATQATRVLDIHTVQGRGVRSTAGDAGYPTVTTEIDATADPTTRTVTGTFSIQYAAISASPARGSDLRGRVVCLSVEGNKAMVGGVVESSNSTTFPVGSAVRIALTDNGDPGSGRDTSTAFLGGEPTCALEPVPELPLIDGNFVVRDGEP